jgi:hypothetical protein
MTKLFDITDRFATAGTLLLAVLPLVVVGALAH